MKLTLLIGGLVGTALALPVAMPNAEGKKSNPTAIAGIYHAERDIHSADTEIKHPPTSIAGVSKDKRAVPDINTVQRPPTSLAGKYDARAVPDVNEVQHPPTSLAGKYYES